MLLSAVLLSVICQWMHYPIDQILEIHRAGDLPTSFSVDLAPRLFLKLPLKGMPKTTA